MHQLFPGGRPWMRRLFIMSSGLAAGLSASALQAQFPDPTVLTAPDSVLHSTCARAVDSNDRYLGAYALDLQVISQPSGQLVLRVVDLKTLSAPQAGCSDRLRLDGTGTQVTFESSTAVIDANRATRYRLQGVAGLGGASIDFSVTQASADPDRAQLTFAASKDGNSDCSFGNVDDCRLFRVTVSISRDASGKATAMVPEASTFTEVLPDVPAVMPDVSPDGTRLAFLHGGPNGTLKFRHSYVLNLASGSLFSLTDGNNHTNQGDWPHWLSDTRIM